MARVKLNLLKNYKFLKMMNNVLGGWELLANNRYYRKFIIPKSDSSGYRDITDHGVTESFEELDNHYEITISVTEEGKTYFENNYKGRHRLFQL